MEKLIPYPGLETALRYFKLQCMESVPYCFKNFPAFDNPKELFDYFKARTTYVNDPKTKELFQTTKTLFEKNYHGITGAGDCDCFTLTTLATCIANDWFNIGIVLCGRKPGKASHIYQYIDFDGERQYIDLTNSIYNFQRPYPYRQEINFYPKKVTVVLTN